VFVIDILKGVAAIALVYGAYRLSLFSNLALATVTLSAWQAWLVALAGLAVLIGHSNSIWLNFTGGKSVATSLGVLFAMSWLVALGAIAVFGTVLALSQIVSLGSVLGAIAVIGLMVALGQPLPYLLFAIAGGIYVIWRHRSNMQRLFAGTEPRIGQKLTQEPEIAVDNSGSGTWLDS
jgi:glycerol-3-phosphate acyltransferase PlsY